MVVVKRGGVVVFFDGGDMQNEGTVGPQFLPCFVLILHTICVLMDYCTNSSMVHIFGTMRLLAYPLDASKEVYGVGHSRKTHAATNFTLCFTMQSSFNHSSWILSLHLKVSSPSSKFPQSGVSPHPWFFTSQPGLNLIIGRVPVSFRHEI